MSSLSMGGGEVRTSFFLFGACVKYPATGLVAPVQMK